MYDDARRPFESERHWRKRYRMGEKNTKFWWQYCVDCSQYSAKEEPFSPCIFDYAESDSDEDQDLCGFINFLGLPLSCRHDVEKSGSDPPQADAANQRAPSDSPQHLEDEDEEKTPAGGPPSRQG